MAKKTELRSAIIGCGGIANGKHMPAQAKIPQVKMVAFCDIVKERADKAAKEYGTPDARVYTDYRQLLEDRTIDAVHVLTPNRSHSEITVAALEAGKHVMCEKPMAKTSEGALKMLAAAQKSGKILTIGYQGRYTNEALYLNQVCRAGGLGEIYFAKAHAVRRRAVPTWGVFLNEEEQGGGPLIDIGTHALDLTLWMMDNYKPKYVVGNTYHKLAERPNSANAWGPWDPAKFTVEDSAFGFVTMENNATIVLEASWALNTTQTGESACTLCGTEAGAEMLGGLKINGEEFSRTYVKSPDMKAGGVAFYEGASEKPQDREAVTFVNAILEGSDLVVKPEQALVVSQILEAIYESSKTGKAVYFK
ncbi:MAG TPA: oxidoreductase [Clostridiales bacterium]|nr:oxidoreductase [Clostridiales bacterium]